jgi:transposase InsO family protein
VYTPEERRAAVAAYRKSGLSRVAFAQLWGVSANSLANWARREQEGGGHALEDRRAGRAGRKKGQRKLPSAVRDEIAQVKRRFPAFGLKKVRDFLQRFSGLRVSVGTVRSVVKEERLPPAPKPKPRRRRKPAVRRFERSRPNELWQSDITGLWLARSARRIYLTVFLDDYSRYVVGFNVATHQRRELVLEAFGDALVRFGKPKEVLTDQGRQYYSWRGKTDFQKRLEREGIKHVVSRAHHPQTLGKTERLWKTVRDELWTRVQPADVAEARERIGHFLTHYNHFRPHQGLDGLVPADRFFGAADTARAAIEKTIQENELALATGEAPRKPVFLFGRVGDKHLSLHGEKGRLILTTDEGVGDEVALDALGAPQEQDDGRNDDDSTEPGEAAAAPRTPDAQEDELQEDAQRPLAGAGALGGSERTRAEASAHALRGDPGVLVGQGDQERGGAAPRSAAAADLAAESAGALGYARGAGAPAALAGGRRSHDEPTGEEGGRRGAEKAHRGAGEGERDPAAGQRAAAAVSPGGDEGASEDGRSTQGEGRETDVGGKNPDEEDVLTSRSGAKPEGGCGKAESPARLGAHRAAPLRSPAAAR